MLSNHPGEWSIAGMPSIFITTKVSRIERNIRQHGTQRRNRTSDYIQQHQTYCWTAHVQFMQCKRWHSANSLSVKPVASPFVPPQRMRQHSQACAMTVPCTGADSDGLQATQECHSLALQCSSCDRIENEGDGQSSCRDSSSLIRNAALIPEACPSIPQQLPGTITIFLLNQPHQNLLQSGLKACEESCLIGG